MAKKTHKYRTNKSSKISRNQDKKSSDEPFTSVELNSSSNFIFYILLFPVFLALTLFIYYFLPSLDSFLYLLSFYSPEKIFAYFFIASFGFVIFCLIFGYLFYWDKLEKRLPFYGQIFFGLNAAIISLIVYPITTGYNPIINYPLIATIFFVVDIVVELTPLVIGYKILKNI